MKATERIRWTVDAMDLRPDDRVLELGCGHGVAVDLIAERVPNGHVVGIDRSEKMIAAATLRNQRHLAARRAGFLCAPVVDAPVATIFEKVLAIHFPPLLRGDATGELAFVREHMATAGRLYIGCQPLSPAHGPTIVGNIADGLQQNNFTVVDTLTEIVDASLLICVVAA